MNMRKAEISQLRDHLADYLKLVEQGETVQVMDGTRAVAELRRLDRAPVAPETPDTRTDLDRRLDELEARGVIRRGKGKIPPEFFTAPRGKSTTSLVDAVIEDREDEEEATSKERRRISAATLAHLGAFHEANPVPDNAPVADVMAEEREDRV
jgi:antitoxin (DNA-binding transcriptional repressor) of toxin-antitoxin stability system